MAISLDEDLKIVRCDVCGEETTVFSRKQWLALNLLLSNSHRIVSRDEIADEIYTDKELLHDGVSDQAIDAVIRRLRVRISQVSERQHIVGFRDWGVRLFLEGKPKKIDRRAVRVRRHG